MTSDLKGNRIRALVIGSSLGIACIAIVFGYVQRQEANRLSSQIKACEVDAIQCQAETEKIKARYEEELKLVHINLSQRTEQLRLALEEAQKQAEAKNKK